MANSTATLWPELDDSLSDDEVLAGPAPIPALSPAAADLDPTTRLISVDVASRYLGRSVGTIHRWVRQGQLPAVKVGRSTMLRVGDVDAFIRAGLIRAVERSSVPKRRNPPGIETGTVRPDVNIDKTVT